VVTSVKPLGGAPEPVAAAADADGKSFGRSEAPLIRVTAMPADANPSGDIFGGWLMGRLDMAAGSLAARVARGRVVTVAADEITFRRPVIVGDEVSIYADLVSVGRTSMRIRAEAWRRAHESDEMLRVSEAMFTFVAIGPDRRPRPVSPDARQQVVGSKDREGCDEQFR
jgi:acyl-CoA thioesterase YciA